MDTTTIRVDRSTHELLSALSADGNSTLQATVHDAAQALRRWRLAERVRVEFAELQAAGEMDDYLADLEATVVSDGVDR